MSEPLSTRIFFDYHNTIFFIIFAKGRYSKLPVLAEGVVEAPGAAVVSEPPGAAEGDDGFASVKSGAILILRSMLTPSLFIS